MYRVRNFNLTEYETDNELQGASIRARLAGDFIAALAYLGEIVKRNGYDTDKSVPTTHAFSKREDLEDRVHVAIREARIPVREHKPIRGMQDAADVLLDHRVSNHVVAQCLRVNRKYLATLRMRYRNNRKRAVE
jgi:hypothetical protein